MQTLPDVQYDTADGLPDGEGCVRLFQEFWRGIHADLDPNSPPRKRHSDGLRLGTGSAIRFAVDPDSNLDVWCHMAGQNPQEVRERLILDYAETFRRYGYGDAVTALYDKYPNHAAFSGRG